jgi:periplasmic divalent cation tolerance protein
MEILVYITVPDMDTARGIGREVVERRLAACVNILPDMESMYWWDGAVQSGQEVVLLAKTTSSALEALTACVVELHPYETPCVVGLPIQGGFRPFLEWIDRETEKS